VQEQEERREIRAGVQELGEREKTTVCAETRKIISILHHMRLWAALLAAWQRTCTYLRVHALLLTCNSLKLTHF
jgi:hypothetical protein